MARPKVVIGDDSALARFLIRLALSGLGLDFFEAASGNAVIRALNEHQPNLLFLDLSMPGADGIVVLKRVRADSRLSALPVIVVTVEGDHEVRARVEELGVSAYLLKPADPQKLRQCTWEALG